MYLDSKQFFSKRGYACKKNQASLLDFFRFFFATRQSNSRQPRVVFRPIHRPKIATFEDRAASKRKKSTKNDTTAYSDIILVTLLQKRR